VNALICWFHLAINLKIPLQYKWGLNGDLAFTTFQKQPFCFHYTVSSVAHTNDVLHVTIHTTTAASYWITKCLIEAIAQLGRYVHCMCW